MNLVDMFSERKKCIFCNSELKNNFFEKDFETYVAHYAVDDNKNASYLIPYNILICDKCNTPQIKYLGDVNEVYKINHADGTGTTMKNMHENKLNLVTKYSNNISGILEIGSSMGILSDFILDNIKTDYYIVEPSYFGNRNKKIIIDEFYENVDDSKLNCNTIIMSHVFEHFYEPLSIVKKIQSNKNIENIFITFPNLEQYLIEGIHHVLNTEHTFYVDNQFIEKLFLNYGFELVEKKFYKSHSVLFYFKRTSFIVKDLNIVNTNYNLKQYFSKIFKIIKNFNNIISKNTEKEIYLFPASCHSIFLTIFGLDYKNLTGMVDNSLNKIGKKVYGLDLDIFSFKEIVKNNKNSIFLINGGVFNSEIEQFLIENKIEYYVGC